jgi:ribosomal protein S12 methylthiotransferase
MKKVNIISFGCPKNLVDSETIAGILYKNGYLLVEDNKIADIIIFNTCAFINSAREEAHQKIEEISKTKSRHQKLIVCGCLPQYEKDTLIKKHPKIDAILGSADFPKIMETMVLLNTSETPVIQINRPQFIISNEPKILSTPKSYAYIKIADGCNNRCNYCIIPNLRGNFRSRTMEDIINDTKNAVSSGRKEIILIAQDTTMYGTDIYGNPSLHILLENLVKIPGLYWIRLLYTHPAHFTDELISTIVENKKICKYIDIPIQHTDDFILKEMGRPSSRTIFTTIEKLRKRMPNIALRTTIMVGFPGETEKHYKKLLNDIRSLQFDWLGVFDYSPQEGTVAFNITATIPEKIKRTRLDEIMKFQQQITHNKNKKRVEKVFDVLADTEKYGHTEFQSPEIDGLVLFSKKHKSGELFKAKISAVEKIYDLVS